MAYLTKAELKLYESKVHNVKQTSCMKILWNKFTDIYCASGDTEKIFDLLCEFYSEKHRAYHNLNHIKFLLGLFEDFGEFIDDKPCVFFTIWFHDAIYDPRKNDNEKQSAELAVKCLQQISLPKEKIRKNRKNNFSNGKTFGGKSGCGR